MGSGVLEGTNVLPYDNQTTYQGTRQRRTLVRLEGNKARPLVKSGMRDTMKGNVRRVRIQVSNVDCTILSPCTMEASFCECCCGNQSQQLRRTNTDRVLQ